MKSGSISNISSPSDEIEFNRTSSEPQQQQQQQQQKKQRLQGTGPKTKSLHDKLHKNLLPPTPSTIATSTKTCTTPPSTTTNIQTFTQSNDTIHQMDAFTPLSMTSPITTPPPTPPPPTTTPIHDINDNNRDSLIGRHIMKPKSIVERGQSISNMSSITFHSSFDFGHQNNFSNNKLMVDNNEHEKNVDEDEDDDDNGVNDNENDNDDDDDDESDGHEKNENYHHNHDDVGVEVDVANMDTLNDFKQKLKLDMKSNHERSDDNHDNYDDYDQDENEKEDSFIIKPNDTGLTNSTSPITIFTVSSNDDILAADKDKCEIPIPETSKMTTDEEDYNQNNVDFGVEQNNILNNSTSSSSSSSSSPSVLLNINNHNIRDEIMDVHKPMQLNQEEEELKQNNVTPNKTEKSSIPQLQQKIQSQSNTIHTQREELKRYNVMLKRYRAKIREKNLSLVSMEKSLNDISMCSDNKTSTDDKECGSDSHDQQQGQEGEESKEKNANKDDCIFDNDFVLDESQSASTIIKGLNCELRTYKQIIASLTDENNNFRSREMEYLQSIRNLENDVKVLQQQSVSHSHLKNVEVELELKKQMVEDLSWKVRTMDENEKEHEYLISDLRQRVLGLEDEVNEGKNEKLILEKLLSNSRNVAASAMMNKDKGNSDDGDDGDAEKNEKTEEENDSNQRSSNIVIKSLEQELEASKKREQELRDQLTEVMKQGEDEKGRSYIMETLTESQQEAILYLTGEVDNLRQKLIEEKQKFDSQVRESQSHMDLIMSLQEENKSFAMDILKHEKMVEKVEEDLTLKSGQNACLRDEIAELEEKTDHLGSVIKNLEIDLTAKDEECKIALTKAQDTVKLSEELKKFELELKKYESKAIAGASSIRDETMVTIDINGTTRVMEDEELSNEESEPADVDAASNRFMVLKKALKKDYEKKMKKLTTQMRQKDEQIEELRKKNEDETTALKKELKLEHFNRITQEALVHQDIENLRNSVRERDHDLFLAKQKIRAMMQAKEEETNWDGFSESLIDGVGATIEILESAWSEESNQGKSSSNKRSFPSFNLSSKSFG